MKKLLLLTLVLGMAFLQACNDECDDVNCSNGGTCVEGTCACLDGFSGTNCETRDIDAFLGTWIGNNVCAGQTGDLVPATITEIEGSNTSVDVDVDGSTFVANIVNGVLIIPETTEEVFGLIVTTSGEGSVNSDGELILETDVTIDGDGVSCTFTGIM